LGGSGIISLDLCKVPTLGDDEEGSSGLSPFVTPCWLCSALRSLRQVLIKVRKRLLSRMSWARVPPRAPLHFLFNSLWENAIPPDRLLFWQMGRLGWVKLFFSLLLLIQLFGWAELHPASVKNHPVS